MFVKIQQFVLDDVLIIKNIFKDNKIIKNGKNNKYRYNFDVFNKQGNYYANMEISVINKNELMEEIRMFFKCRINLERNNRNDPN